VSAYGAVNGRFVSADGVPVGTQFPIKTGSVGQYPRVAYSPDVNGGNGGFLVTWQQSDTINNVFARLVSYTAGLIGVEQQLSFDGAFNESGAAVAYSTVAKEFMVVWDGMWRDPATNALSWKSIVAQRIGVDGNKLGNQMLVAGHGAGDTGLRDPSIAYNPDRNEYLVVYSGWIGSFAFVNAQRTAPVTGALLPTGDSAGAKQLSVATGTYITEVAYNTSTKQYLASWYQFGTYGYLLDGVGNLASSLLLQASRFAAYDALGLAYNTTSGTYMMVSHDSGGTLEDGATELSGTTGKPISSLFATQTTAVRGNFYPKVAAAAGRGEWLMSTATDFAATTVQRLGSTGTAASVPLSITMTADKTMPVAEGTAITWTVNATGGTAPYQYQFFQYSTATGWTLAQPYSSSNTFTWTPNAGAHSVQVWVRSSGSSAAYDSFTSFSFTIISPSARLTSFTANVVPSTGAPVTFTAMATASSAVEYLFLRYASGTGWMIGQGYSPVNTYTMYPTFGTNYVQVWVRRIGLTVAYEDWTQTAAFTVGPSMAKLVSVSPSTLISAPGVPLTWTAVGGGGFGVLEYKFFLYDQGSRTWFTLRDWSTNPQATWTFGPTGLYLVQAWVRTVGSGFAYEDFKSTQYFTITTSTALTLAPNRDVTILRQGDIVTFTATVAGAASAWEYKFFMFDGSSWTVLADYSSQNYLVWAATAGTKTIEVWGRPVGSSAAYERFADVGPFVVRP
jgi:hypothetical protein